MRNSEDRFEPQTGAAPIPGGNERERLKISSGKLLIIDQFMLANHQFIEPLTQLPANDPAVDALIKRFGGVVTSAPVGTYAVFRHAQDRFMVVYPCSDSGEAGTEPVSPFTQRAEISAVSPLGGVTIDTRAVVFADIDVLLDGATRGEYLRLWQQTKRKEARDYLRTKGAAVRYGFSHRSDLLQVGTAGNGVWVLTTEDRNQPYQRRETEEVQGGLRQTNADETGDTQNG